MTILKNLALAGFQMEKQAGRYDSPGALKNIAGDLVGAVEKHTPTAIAAGIGARIATKKPVEKKAGLLDVAKSMASTAKGVGSVAKNLVKQNPTAAKAAAGGALAGIALSKMTQTKQAEDNKNPYGVLRHTRDAAMTAVDAYAGKALGGIAAAVTSKHHFPSMAHSQRVGFGKGIGMAAGFAVGAANSIGRHEAHQKQAAKKDPGLAKEEKDDVGPFKAYVGEAAKAKAKKKIVQTKQAAVKDPGLAKEEKDDVGPFNAYEGEAAKGSGKGPGKSSLVAAAKAEMAKAAAAKK